MRVCIGQILVVYEKVLKIIGICKNESVLVGYGQVGTVCPKPSPLWGLMQSSHGCVWVLHALLSCIWHYNTPLTSLVLFERLPKFGQNFFIVFFLKYILK